MIHVGFEFLCPHPFHNVSQLLFGGVCLTVFLLHHHQRHEVGIAVADEFLGIHIDHLHGDVGDELLQDSTLVFYRGDRFVGDEVIHILCGKLLILHFVLIGKAFLYLTFDLVLDTLIFCSSETEVVCTLGFTQYSGIRLLDLPFLGESCQREGAAGSRHEVIAIVAHSLQIGAVGLLGFLAESGVQHEGECIVHVFHEEIVHVDLHLIGNSFVLHVDEEEVKLLFLVLIHHIDCGIVGAYLLWYHFCGIGRHLDVGKQRLDLCFDMIYVHITHHDDGLVVWAIPFAIVVAQGFGVASVDDAHQSDRHAEAVFLVLVEARQTAL